MVLAREVHSGVHHQLPLIHAGVRLEDHHRVSLMTAGINAVYVEDELGKDIEVTPALTPQTRALAMGALVRTFAESSAKLTEGGSVPSATLLELGSAVRHICDDIAHADHAVLALTDLASADSYTLQHSLDVTALGLLIARRHFRDYGRPASLGRRSYEDIETQLVKLGVGLLLHDIGKLALPAAILKKSGSLTPEEIAIVRTHPLAGLELVRGDVLSPLPKGVIRAHHERWDGQGYPHRCAGTDIPEFARIAAVADAFDAITSERVYSAAAPAHVGVRAILEDIGRAFDPVIVETFRKVVAPYPPGCEITLADGRRGVVVSVPVGEVDRPLVRVLWDASGERVEVHEVDLRSQPLLAPVVGVTSRAA
jgi:HD-GYP domain-containing protein (c-di-GMP phosphodiesterase class II)